MIRIPPRAIFILLAIITVLIITGGVLTHISRSTPTAPSGAPIASTTSSPDPSPSKLRMVYYADFPVTTMAEAANLLETNGYIRVGDDREFLGKSA
jgi:hypothetical protein